MAIAVFLTRKQHMLKQLAHFGRSYLMKDAIQQRACELASYIIKHRATVRAAARQFGISKSTVHKDVKERLKHIDPDLYAHACLVLSYNKAVRHLRGGEATRRKYQKR